MEFIDFLDFKKDRHLSLILPGWKKGEGVAFFSPHDDDALLGAGYLILAVRRSGGIPFIFVFCRGDAGYSNRLLKKDIVGQRKKEAGRAYGPLGVKPENIHFFDIPDFSLPCRLDRRPACGEGVFDKTISALRRERISRVVFSSGYHEHWDHTGVFHAGIYISPQAQDPILADLGKPQPIKTYLAYSVWGDFEPTCGEGETRADLGILAAEKDEESIAEAVRSFSSQSRIIQSIVERREGRKTARGYLELYKSYRPRMPIDYSPYLDLLRKISLKTEAHSG